MKLIIKGRGKGKTEEMIKLSLMYDQNLVVANSMEKKRILEIVSKTFYIQETDFPRIFTFDDIIEKKYLGHSDELIIDNLDFFMEYLTLGRVKAVSLTSEEVEEVEIEKTDKKYESQSKSLLLILFIVSLILSFILLYKG